MSNFYKRIVNLLLSLLMLCGSNLIAQNPTIPNPSPCGMGRPLTDNSCPENGVFYDPDSFNIVVLNAPGDSLGVDVFLKEVRLIIGHSWTGDLDISLISPSGIVVELTSDNGGGDDNYGDPEDTGCTAYTSFSMASCTPIQEGSPPFTPGSYQPEESFFKFNDGLTSPVGGWILQICDDVEEDVGTLEFVHLIFEAISCLPIEEIEVLNVDSTTVELSWEPSDCANTILEYGLPGFSPGIDSMPGGGTVVFADCPPFSLEGLAEDTQYELYIRKYCDDTGNFSGNSCPALFRTGCLPPAATIVETFDTLSTCPPFCGLNCLFDAVWSNGAGDDFDWLVRTGATPTLGTGPKEGASGAGKYVYLEASGNNCTNGNHTFLVSHCIQLDKQGSDTCHLSFNYHMFGDNIGSLRLEATIDGGFNWTPLWSKSGNQGDKWHKTYIGLSDFTDGALMQFRFVGTGGNGAKGDIALDDIVFFGSIDLGSPSFQYFADLDNDGYGAIDDYIFSCEQLPPAGFVTNDEDCDDSNPTVNPGMPEIPCDNIDNNCNDDIINDDPILPPPEVQNDTVCSGEFAIICADPVFGRPIFWYGSHTGSDIIGFGNCLSPSLPENNSPVPVVHRFYAEESDFVCFSQPRAEAIVIVNPRPDAGTADVPEICPGQPFDQASLNIEDANFTGGTITFHSASPANAANELSSTVVGPLATSTYFYLLTSPDGCTDENPITVFVKPGPNLSFLPADSFSLCREGIDTVEVLATGGAGGYTYIWSNGEEDAGIEVEAAFVPGTIDIYGITVTDAEGCFTTDSVFITTTNSIDSLKRIVKNVSNCMGSDGSITLIPLNGLSPFQFHWEGSNGITGDSIGVTDTLVIDMLPQGSYSVTITDSSLEACEFVLRSVLVNGPDAVIEAPNIVPLTCYDAADGSICLNVSGTNPQFLWNTGQTSTCIENLPGGVYSVTITDGGCQTILNDLLVDEPDSLKSKANLHAPSCFDGSDGVIDVTIFGGTPPYSFSWSTASTDQDIGGLAAGSYQLTVTDANDCQLTEAYQLGAPAPLEVMVDSLRNMSCNGFADGFIKVSGSGGTSPYQYAWNTGSTSPVLPNLSLGTYTVSITDFNGCQNSHSFTLSEPAPIQLELIAVTEPECVGDKNGSLTVAVTGGTPPYSYLWNTGETESMITGLGVGDYLVQVSDTRGCPGDSLTVELTAVSTLDLVITIVPPDCVGPESGQIQLQPIGTPPFFYDWDRGDTTQDLLNVGVGEYAVTIEDGQGCIYDTSMLVTAPQVFDVDINVFDPGCYRGEDGIIGVNLLQSGTPPIDFNWSNGSTSQSLIGVGDGQYVVTINDFNGCRYISDSILVSSPTPLALTLLGTGNIACHGDSTGFIELDIRGGTAPYFYTWLDIDAHTEDIFNLPAGEYRLLMQDANSCPIDTTFLLSEPSALEAHVDLTIGDVCAGDTSNKLTASAQGGTPPYQFLWNTGATDTCLVNVPPGDYELSVKDAKGCSDVLSSIKVRDLGSPVRLDTFYTTDISCQGAADGTMTAQISGGSGNYRYHFSNNHILTTSADSVRCLNLAMNTNYSVTVTDLNNGCFVVSQTESVLEPPPLFIIRDGMQDINCFGGNDGAVYVTTFGGTPPYSFAWFDSSGILVDTLEDLLNVLSGTYTLVVTDSYGCLDSLAETALTDMNEVIHLVDSLTLVVDVACKGESTGLIDITIGGGQPPFEFEWSNGFTSEDILNVPAGTYELTVTDSDTCRAIFPLLMVKQPISEIVLSQASVDSVSCFGFNDGSIQVTATGGSPPYELSWAYEGNIIEGQTTDGIDSLLAGNYTLILEDTNSCIKEFSFQVEQAGELIVTINAVPPIPPDENGSATAEVVGGTPQYSYLWNTGDTTSTIEIFTEGTYTVSVTDAKTCTTVQSTLVTATKEPASIIQSIKLYPNPSSGEVVLEYLLAKAADLKLEVYTPLGRQLQTRIINQTRQGKFQIDLQAFPSGIYWLSLVSEGERIFGSRIVLVLD